MASSSSSKAKGTGNQPSSLNGVNSLLANEMQDVDRQQKIEEQWLKIQQAEYLRLMQDNQKVLDTTTAAERATRQQQHRFRESYINKMMADESHLLKFPEDTMGDINIDSPENHYHYPPPRPSAPTWMKAALAAALTAVAGLGGYALSGLLNRPTPAPVNTRVENTEGFLIELVPGNGKQP